MRSAPQENRCKTTTLWVAFLSALIFCSGVSRSQENPYSDIQPLPPVGDTASAEPQAAEANPKDNATNENATAPAANMPAPGEEAEEVPAEPAAGATFEGVEGLDMGNLWEPNVMWFWTHWEGNVELGLSGSVGNSNTDTYRVGLDLKRTTEIAETTFSTDYKLSTQNSVDTENRLFIEWRNEWCLSGKAWTIYIHGTHEFDQFRAFDTRLQIDMGTGLQIFKTEVTKLKGRAGAGFSREFGGPDDVFVPEGVLGLDFERRLSKRQKLTATVDYYFDWGSFSEYRVNSKANWEIIIDEESHLTLKIGVADRYDSTPNGAKPNDLDYSTILSWDF